MPFFSCRIISGQPSDRKSEGKNFDLLTATLESISSWRLFVFESLTSSISVGSVYSGSEGKDTSFKVFKLLSPLKKTVMVFQCMFVTWLSKSRRQSQKETSLPIDSVSRKNGKVFTFTGIPWRNFALKCLQSFWLHLRKKYKKTLIDLHLSFLGVNVSYLFCLFCSDS